MPPAKRLDSPCKRPAQGVSRAGMVYTCVFFDPDTFAEIRSLAVAQNTSFSEQVRRLVEFGLIDMKEAA